MSSDLPPGGPTTEADTSRHWYELFSRGSRDWLRHSDKIREAVREHLPQIVGGSDIINDSARTVRVPVKMLEHYRFRLRADAEPKGVGQGSAKPGDLLGPVSHGGKPGGKGAGGTERGGAELLLEFKVDDIIDWMWEELCLPNLQPRAGHSDEADWKREGWDRRGARSRLDRRRSVKESVKRRGLDTSAPAFIDEDLRYRQLTRRRQPALRAAVFFLLDVSASMTEADRQLAKTFFFWVAAGLRREYRSLDIVFVAHTTDAWEFSEADFFRVSGSGGTVASAGLNKVHDIIAQRFDPGSCNVYLFYASDGDNAVDDREGARTALDAITRVARYAGYVEISSGLRSSSSETAKLFDALSAPGSSCSRCSIRDANDVTAAVRHFFTVESKAAAADAAPRKLAMRADWRSYLPRLEDLAHTLGLDWSPVIFEAVPDSFMTEIAVYGLPVRMPHWSFGARYIYQLLQRHMGYSRLFEVVFPGNPGRAYLASSNGLADNTLVAAHVLGHADFSKNNLLFRRSQEQGAEHIIEHAASHARQIERDIEAYGFNAVERVLDAALSLEQYIDVDRGLRRGPYPEYLAAAGPPQDDAFRSRFATLDTDDKAITNARRLRAPLPPHPEKDLLWFIATYAPDLESWERDIFLAVRAESFYFYPVHATQTMNEGWASYWHARLLREADFIPQDMYLDAIRCHSDVVRPVAAEEQIALAVNPYHLGFTLWEEIIKQSGLETARKIMREDDDFSFLRNNLTREMASEMGLFRFQKQQNGPVRVLAEDIDELRETLLHHKYNFGAPRVSVSEVRSDGTMVLEHNSAIDKRGLDTESARKVLDYVAHVWRRPVLIRTVDAAAKPVQVLANPTSL